MDDLGRVLSQMTIMVFVLSFSWMLTGRINVFPKIRRFYAIGYLFDKNNWKDGLKETFILLSWPFMMVIFTLSFYALGKFNNDIMKVDFKASLSGLNQCMDALYYAFLKPLAFVLIPQFCSRTISSSVILIGPIRELIIIKEHKLIEDAFSADRRKHLGLNENDNDDKAPSNRWRRFIWSIVILAMLFLFVLLF